MGRRNLLTKFQVWDNLDSTTPAESRSTVVDGFDVVKYVLAVDPTVSGTIQVEFSDDQVSKDEVWKELDFKSPITIDGSIDTDYEIHIKEHVCHKLRLKFANAGGTGNVNAWISATSVGA